MPAPLQIMLTEQQLDVAKELCHAEGNLINAVAVEATNFGGIVAIRHHGGTVLVTSTGQKMEEGAR